ncbi:hypothetical protein JTE90_017597 [Oedothorax gibbosus]|uniref:Uncharacterized protein n=1 Tax=Oedothorax gibbosus TaxID=931172 RepID=A0AAV6TMZ0_9ARAC|nr:hypothetical protein JTE90_017597 [Oedothorax gibbosus]
MRSSQKYCCVRKCILAPSKWNRYDVPCRECKAYGFCHCQCVSYPNDDDHNNVEGVHTTRVFYVKRCCRRECFWMDWKREEEETDGIACSKCKSYFYCLCKCVTWTRSILKQSNLQPTEISK